MLVVRDAARVVVAAAALVFGTVTAQASEATQLAERAGFLIGHALRCGVKDTHIQRSGMAIQQAIAAFATDDQDQQDAETRFGAWSLAGSLAEFLDDPLPSCKTVIAEFSRFEREGAASLAQSGKQGTGNKRSSLRSPASNAAARPKNQHGRFKKLNNLPRTAHATQLIWISAFGAAGITHEGGKPWNTLEREVRL